MSVRKTFAPARRRLLAAVFAAGVVLSAHAAASSAAFPGLDCDRPLTLGLHEHGLLYTAQSGAGIDKDIADEMARRSGCRITLTVLPRARIWQLLESGTLDFTLTGIASEQREKYASFAWYVSNKYYLLVRKDAGVHGVDDFAHDPALRLGVIRGFRYGPDANAFADALERQGRVTYSTTLEPLYAVLREGRIQAMIVEPFDYPAIGAAEWRAFTEVLDFGDAAVPHGLAMSRRSLKPAQLEAWQALIRSMRADGTMLRIFGKYFPPELARAMTSF